MTVQPNSFRTGPDERGFFGIYGGRFVAETLMPLILELERPTRRPRPIPAFHAELDGPQHALRRPPEPALFRRAADRASSAGRGGLGRSGGAKIYFKRDELNHTGTHKINNCLGQILLARRMGKTRIIAETGAGQHGVATATVARALRLPLRRLYGRDRHRAAEAQRLPHEAPRRRGEAGHVGQAHAQGRHERGAPRLGDQCRDHLLPDRHRRRPASLSGDGARLPVGDRQRGARADSGRPKAACPTRSSPASAAARTPSASSIPSSTTARSRSTASRPAATGSTSRTAMPLR